MTSFYYPNNEVLPRWRTPAGGRSWGAYALGVVVLLVATALIWKYWPESDNVRRAKAATVYIEVSGRDSKEHDVGMGSGSGVLISPKGYILTNRHVLTLDEKSAKSTVRVFVNPGTAQQELFSAVNVEDKSKEPWDGQSLEKIRNDWCVLHITRKEPFEYLSPSDKKSFAEMETLYSYGFPAGREVSSNDRGPEVKVSLGRVTRLGTGNGGGTVCLTHDALIDHGSSGGPLLQDGKIVGINTGGPQHSKGEGWAIPAYLLKESVFDKFAK
jgi:S1-C subfamily serine protease